MSTPTSLTSATSPTSTRPDTDDQSETPVPPPDTSSKRRRRSLPFGLSAAQLTGTALAATTATFAASFLGVTGTVIGAAIASVVSAIGNAVYTQSLRRTGNVVRTAVPKTRALPRSVIPAEREKETPPAEQPPVLPTPAPRSGEAVMWRRIAMVAIGIFVAVLTLITVVEVAAGRPISDLVRGKSGGGTTFFGSVQTRTKLVPVTPTVTVTVTPKVVYTTPTVTQTAPTVTQSPSSSPSGSAAGSASGSPTSGTTPSDGALPSGSSTPSSSPTP